MELPDIKVVGPQVTQTLLQGRAGSLGVSLVYLGHEDDILTATRERFPHAFLGAALVIAIGVVEEVHSQIQSAMNDGNRLFLVLRQVGVMTADSHHGNLQPCSAEGALGNFAKGLRSLRPIVSNAAQSRRERCRRSSLEERSTV